jgi:release factor glutamine methyltransferase
MFQKIAIMTRYGELTIGEAWKCLAGELSGIYDQHEASAIGRELFLRLLQIGPDQRIIRAGEVLQRNQQIRLATALDLLRKGMPVQYVTRVTNFLDLELEVGPGVLIPRQETQELVLWAVSVIKNTIGDSKARILDIGTGSGCIALSMASLLNQADVYACDISEEALETARKNAINHKLIIQFFLCDILEESNNNNLANYFFSAGEYVARSAKRDADCLPVSQLKDDKERSELFDSIISNPPYVRESEKADMKTNVLGYEPEIALFVDDEDPLIYYRAIAREAKKCLKPGGLLFFEINEAFGNEIVMLMEQLGFVETRLKQDLHGKDRFVMGRRKS